MCIIDDGIKNDFMFYFADFIDVNYIILVVFFLFKDIKI